MRLLSIILAVLLLSAPALAQPAGKQATATTANVQAIRAARLPTCPEEKDLAEKCPGGAVQVSGYCLCFAGAQDVVGEVKVAPRNRMIICEAAGDDGKKYLQVRYENEVGPLEQGCVLVVEDLLLPGVSMSGMETGTEEKLRVRCAPCPISSTSWGHCPYCLHPSYGVSCSKACPVVEVSP